MQLPPWNVNMLQIKFNHRHNTNQSQSTRHRQHNNNNARNNKKNIFMVVPYARGLSESFKKTWNSLGIQVYFKGSKTICTLLVVPKDKDTICQKVG